MSIDGGYFFLGLYIYQVQITLVRCYSMARNHACSSIALKPLPDLLGEQLKIELSSLVI
jgi:hypothetical protein